MARRRFTPDPALDALLASVSKPQPAKPLPPRQSVAPRTPACAVRPKAKNTDEGSSKLTGVANLHHRGFGFVTTPDGLSYYLRANLARAVLAGDRVEFSPAPVKDDTAGPEVGSVTAVSRQSFLLLGELHRSEAVWAFRPDEPCFLPLTLTGQESLPTTLNPGDVAAVRVPAYAGTGRPRPVQVVAERILGPRDREGFAQDYALVRHGFHESLPEAAAAETTGLSAAAEPDEARADLTAVPFVTIDGESTRDFDDAVYAVPVAGGWEVRVAVADVSWYVRPESELDAWASQRCTSIYLPGRVEPMLPEALSTDCCALTPGGVKRAVVLTLRLSAEGQVSGPVLERAWVRSAARLTYSEVAVFLAGGNKRYAGEVEGNLAALADVYALLAVQRAQKGKIEFDEPEPVMQPSADGGWQLTWESRTEAHKLVEELMLLANRVAAERLLARYGTGLLRHQPPPEAEDWQTLRTWAAAQDFELPEAPCMRALADLAAAPSDTEGAAAVSHRIRACMRPAKYTLAETGVASGHFSLSFDWYTHFTSPIRRYADLLVHRLLLAPEGAGLAGGLDLHAERCSERAQASRLAERLVWDGVKLQSFVVEVAPDTVLKARIARITPRGLRVVIQGWQCGAWLPASSLRDSGYRFADRAWSLQGQAALQEGASLAVRWTEVLRDRPAYPELQVALAARALVASAPDLEAA